MAELMTEYEKAAIFRRSMALKEAGKLEEAEAVWRTIPLPAYLAKVSKEKWGLGEHLAKSGWNLSEAEAEFGKDWLTR
jgi:hypothetical protein